MSSGKSFYDILEVHPTASSGIIKQRFQKLILQHHPDKQAATADSDDAYIHQLLEAWEVLKDPELRKSYDARLKAQQLKQGAVINGDVDLDEMDYDEETGTFSLPCRCSGSYTIREQDMENGVDVASCDNCSLIIRVLYDVVEDDEQ
ncbi:DNAJ heat shock N-terminal domain-containing protein [Umbelopsis sp. PMI_123]|nr:DNAJ heat shock N-terminal domain-containing protein [Umbelopsis sp. PMI_123]